MAAKKNRELTIYDIASELSLSPSTVSRALKDHHSIGKKTKNKVKKFATEHGYKPNSIAASLRNNKTNTIGVITSWINRPFISALISGVEQGANQAGYNVIFSQSHDSYENEVNNAATLYGSRVEGLVVSLAMETQQFDHFQQFVKNNIPVVFVDRVTAELNSDLVVIDNFKAGFTATEHLIEQGCKRIAHIGGAQNLNVYADRERGYLEALKKYKIPFNENLIVHCSLSAEDGTKAANQLFDKPDRPDGIFCANDTSAVSVIQIAKKRGIRIPEEVAIIGFNNDPVSMIIDPPLSTISQPAVDMGIIAAQQVLKHKGEKKEIITSETVVLKTELLIRESSKRK